MKENTVKVVIKKPINKVFEFTTNPTNTHLWIESIEVEEAEPYPPIINKTKYRNRGKDLNWDVYRLIEFEKNKIFTLSNGDYQVRYTYKDLGNNSTELTYYEWMTQGELSNPFTQDVLNKLKEVIEK